VRMPVSLTPTPVDPSARDIDLHVDREIAMVIRSMYAAAAEFAAWREPAYAAGEAIDVSGGQVMP
jgi:hypothetical protein